MWKLNQIYAKNLCSFKELSYQILQGHTTLIYGNNQDNDSQGSNGSGKSAMLEAIAIGLTGETLRKVKTDEIINDEEDNAIIALILTNDSSGNTLYIRREFSRKAPQDISIVVTTPDKQPNKIIQAGVMDYNKYILETIGLSKDDIYSNFVLSKHKYSSFLSSSDREKKEIINRFSNGIIVDESISALQEDMVVVEKKFKDAEMNVAVLNGKIDALTEQIDITINEQEEKKLRKAERIESWKKAIIQKRELIRNMNANIDNNNEALNKIYGVDDKIQGLEEANRSLKESYETILKWFEDVRLTGLSDYNELSHHYNCGLKELEDARIKLFNELSAHNEKVEEERKSYNNLTEEFEDFQKKYEKQSEDIQHDIDMLTKNIRESESELSNLNRKNLDIQHDIAELHNLLAGVIVCPACKHEFILSNNIDINKKRLELEDCREVVSELVQTIANKQSEITTKTTEKKRLHNEQHVFEQHYTDLSLKVKQKERSLNLLIIKNSEIDNRIKELDQKYNSLKRRIESSKTDLFDEAYNIIDSAAKALENSSKQLELDIKNANGAIQSYEESIKEAESSTFNDAVENLQIRKSEYEQEVTGALLVKESVERQLNELKVQEATFIEFKTYLANSKIDALSRITNEFLEAIGSDIRILFSGFTVLKSGKVRDKISISLLRNGVDCGSYDKFSEGEKTRVNLASILAMHKLTNLNCDDDKGLDLLVLDEILEATDEQGLANIFNALNQLQITSLVVSHGSTAENYPYKTVVNKLNGVSYIND